MSITPQVSGPALIKVSTGEGSALESLGYTEDGQDIDFSGHWYRVYASSRGDEDGPPVDFIWCGSSARMDMALSEWDEEISDKLEPFLKGGTRGQPTDEDYEPGTSLYGANKALRVVLVTTSEPLNFPRCVLTNFRRSKSTKYNKLYLTWEMFEDSSGVLYDETTS